MAQLPSYISETRVRPMDGRTMLPDLSAAASSIVSGQNCWVRNEGLTPRWRLSTASLTDFNNNPHNPTLPWSNVTNPSSSGTRCLGMFGLHSAESIAGNFWVMGNQTQVAVGFWDASFSTLKFSWQALQFSSGNTTGSYISSTVTPFTSRTTNSNWRGTMVYSLPLNLNLLVMTAGDHTLPTGNDDCTHLLATSLGFSDTGVVSYVSFSFLSGATPRALDVTNFGNRVVAWHCDNVPQRVQWHIEGDPNDWTGTGSGFQDLADMQGNGTRIFAEEDHMVLASTEEIWRGRYSGLPYIFSFSPINRGVGMPYPRATLQTQAGIYWLGRDLSVYQLVGEQVTNLGQGIQPLLQQTLQAPDVAFLTYDEGLQQLRLFYSTTTSSYPTRSVVYDFTTTTWMEEAYSHVLQNGVSVPLVVGKSGTPELAGYGWRSPRASDIYSAVATSAGTVARFQRSATSDLGSDVAEQAVFGTIQHDSLRIKKIADEFRVDVAGRSASSLSVGLSVNNGASYSYETRLNVSASSNASQLIQNPNIPGDTFTFRVASTNGGWELRRYWLGVTDSGEAR